MPKNVSSSRSTASKKSAKANFGKKWYQNKIYLAVAVVAGIVGVATVWSSFAATPAGKVTVAVDGLDDNAYGTSITGTFAPTKGVSNPVVELRLDGVLIDKFRMTGYLKPGVPAPWTFKTRFQGQEYTYLLTNYLLGNNSGQSSGTNAFHQVTATVTAAKYASVKASTNFRLLYNQPTNSGEGFSLSLVGHGFSSVDVPKHLADIALTFNNKYLSPDARRTFGNVGNRELVGIEGAQANNSGGSDTLMYTYSRNTTIRDDHKPVPANLGILKAYKVGCVNIGKATVWSTSQALSRDPLQFFYYKGGFKNSQTGLTCDQWTLSYSRTDNSSGTRTVYFK